MIGSTRVEALVVFINALPCVIWNHSDEALQM